MVGLSPGGRIFDVGEGGLDLSRQQCQGGDELRIANENAGTPPTIPRSATAATTIASETMTITSMAG